MANENIIIFVGDDFGQGDAFATPFPIQFPNFNSTWRTQGTRIRFGASAAAICSASRYGLLCGRRPNDDGLHTVVEEGSPRNSYTGILAGQATIASVLKAGGYYTALFGKWHMGKHAAVPTLFNHGFDEMQGHSFPSGQPGVSSGYLGADFITLSGGGGLAYSRDVDQLIADKVIAAMANARTAGKPWCIFVTWFAPHTPLNPSSADLAALAGMAGASGQITPMQTYYAAIYNIDEQLGRIRAAMSAAELNNTFLIWSADNGAGISDTPAQSIDQAGRTRYFRGGKLQVLNGGVMQGLSIRGPRVPQGKLNTNAVFSYLDLAPTLCSMVGVPWTGDGHGEDRSEVLYGKDVQRQTPLFWLTTEANGSTVDMPNRGLPIRGFFPAAGPDGTDQISVYLKVVDGDITAQQAFDLQDWTESNDLLNPDNVRCSMYGPEIAATHAWFQSLGTVTLADPLNWGVINPDLAGVSEGLLLLRGEADHDGAAIAQHGDELVNRVSE